MKQTIILIALLASAIAFAQIKLDTPTNRTIRREINVTAPAQRNALENLWNSADRPLRTNSTMQRYSFTRVVSKDTNGVATATNYLVSVIDSVKVILVEQ